MIRQKVSDWIFSNTTFPNGCKTRNELDWMLKDNCPCCLREPIECLSNRDYHIKYPARNKIDLGMIKIYLCDLHLDELKDALNKCEG